MDEREGRDLGDDAPAAVRGVGDDVAGDERSGRGAVAAAAAPREEETHGECQIQRIPRHNTSAPRRTSEDGTSAPPSRGSPCGGVPVTG